MQRPRHQPPHQPPGTNRCFRERRAGRAQAGLGERGQEGADEQRQRELERLPNDAEPRHGRERRGQQMPLGHMRQKGDQTTRRLVQRLKRRGPPDAVVDARAAPPQHAGEARAVHATGPAHVARPVVLLGPLPLEHRLRPAIPYLLLPVGSDRIAAVVPDHSRRVESQRPPPLLQPPTHVHVVAGDPELWIEAADRREARLANGHVAARDVLGLPVGDEDVTGSARRAGYALRDRSVAGRGDVGTADTGVRRTHERRGEIAQPVWVGVGVVVEVGDDRAGRGLEAGVARGGEAAVLRLDQTDTVTRDDGRSRVG